MIHRVLGLITLLLSVVMAVSLGLSVLIGQRIPTGEQITILLPSFPRWTKIALVDVERQISASRLLPMRAVGMEWMNPDRLIIYGTRTRQPRVYALNYGSGTGTSTVGLTRIDLLRDGPLGYVPASISRDLHWMAAGTEQAAGKSDITLQPLDGQHIDLAQIASIQPPSGSYFLWSHDSRLLLYTPGYYGQDTVEYDVIDTRSGEKYRISQEQIYDLVFTPDGRHLFYSTRSPDPGGIDVQGQVTAQIETYYVYDLETHTARQVMTGPLYAWVWSPDGTKLAYLRPLIAPDQVSRVDAAVKSKWNGEIPNTIYGGANGTGFYIRFGETMRNPANAAQVSYSLNMYDVPVQPGILEIASGADRLIGEARKDYATIDWLPNSNGVLLTTSHETLIIPQAVPSPGVITSPAYGLYYAHLDDPEQTDHQPLPLHPLNQDGAAMTVLKPLPPDGDRLVMTAMTAGPTPNSYLVDTHSGTVLPLTLPPNEVLIALTWSPDGQQFILTTRIQSGTSTTFTVRPYIPPVSGARPVLSTATPAPSTLTLQVVPAGNGVGIYHNYLVRGDSTELILLNTDSPADWLRWSADGSKLLSYQIVPDGTIRFLSTDLSLPDAKPEVRAQISVPAGRTRDYLNTSDLIQWRPDRSTALP